MFEPFSNLPVALPEPSHLLLNIIVYRLPNKIKNLLNKQRKQGDDP